MAILPRAIRCMAVVSSIFFRPNSPPSPIASACSMPISMGAVMLSCMRTISFCFCSFSRRFLRLFLDVFLSFMSCSSFWMRVSSSMRLGNGLLGRETKALAHLDAPAEERLEVLATQYAQIGTEALDLVRRLDHLGEGRERDVAVLGLVKVELVVLAQHGDGIRGLDELARGHLLVQEIVALLVTVTLALLDLGVENTGLVVGRRVGEFGKDGLGVEEAGIDALRGLEAAAHDEDFGRHVARRRRLGGLDLGEQLVEHPHERVVVLGAEDLGDKGAALDEELGGQLHGLQHELGLVERILHPGRTDVGRTIVEHGIGFPGLEVLANGGATLFGGNVALEGNNFGDGLDGRQINTDNDAAGRHGLYGDLTPGLEGLAMIQMVHPHHSM
ncbi:hypothetical protein F503_08851 [Ophiostoma piceae UAMH 11346]|uniref:Uncharacterized protein n=1 Tax=Ophiostoma piceae (strain UAMH 11346) TaxID=1262450 RepID=S3BNZ9_OPHP1|nr:hypothetical protein F503_08851 [Ophiostoma piceae UAMH 11346]